MAIHVAVAPKFVEARYAPLSKRSSLAIHGIASLRSL
jgi:hypothetical protein